MTQPETQATRPKLAVIILAAGHGTRMKSTLPKVLHEIGGLPLLGHALKTAAALNPDRMAIVIGNHAPEVGDVAGSLRPGIEVFVQDPPQGTGDAVRQALPMLDGFSGSVLVLYADTPLMRSATLAGLANLVGEATKVAVLGFRPSLEHAYGRLVIGVDGGLEAIVEARDATPEQLEIDFCNSGVMAIDAAFVREAVPALNNDNAKKEYYLTDFVAMARDSGFSCAAQEADEAEVMGVDSRSDLAVAERIFQDQMRRAMMDEGVTLRDPSTVYFSYDTRIGRDVVIGQHVVFGPGVSIADGVEVKPFSHLEGARLASGVAAGPFARLRPGADLGPDVKVGNFVEIKKAKLGRDTKVSHLTYLGDADIGEDVNIGAGTITCNYDGFEKFVTTIKDGAFIGSNSALVAPVTIGAGAYVGSGSVITKTVEPDALAVARGRQTDIPGWAGKFRNGKKEQKEKA